MTTADPKELENEFSGKIDKEVLCSLFSQTGIITPLDVI